MEDVFCRKCHETGPPEERQMFIPTQPGTNRKEDVCSACGSSDIIPADDYRTECEMKGEGTR